MPDAPDTRDGRFAVRGRDVLSVALMVALLVALLVGLLVGLLERGATPP